MGLVGSSLLAPSLEAQVQQLALFRKGTRRKTRTVRLLDRILSLEIDEGNRETSKFPTRDTCVRRGFAHLLPRPPRRPQFRAGRLLSLCGENRTNGAKEAGHLIGQLLG